MNLQLFGLDDDKLTSFTFDHVGQVDELGKVTGNYVTIQQYLDSRGIDLQDAHNALIDSLMDDAVAGATGASQLGIKATGVVASNVEDAVAEVQANVAGAVAGEIPNNTLTELKMAADMKKATGGVYPYDDGDQNATDIATNTANIADNAEAIDEVVDIRVSTDTTGSADAYIVTVSSVFDFTLDGNVIRINPNFTNAGSATIAVNGTTKAIRKFDIDTDSYVVLEAEDIKKNNPTELRYDVSEGFFVLAPKQGAELTGDALVTDVEDGKTFYNTDAKTKLTGTKKAEYIFRSGTRTSSSGNQPIGSFNAFYITLPTVSGYTPVSAMCWRSGDAKGSMFMEGASGDTHALLSSANATDTWGATEVPTNASSASHTYSAIYKLN